MKRTLFIARPATAILTSIIMLAGMADVKASENTTDTDKSNITYVGTENNLLAFNISYTNPANEKVILHLTNDRGEVLLHKVYNNQPVNTNLYLKSTGEKCRVYFTLSAGREIINQNFEIEPVTKVITETVVTRL